MKYSTLLLLAVSIFCDTQAQDLLQLKKAKNPIEVQVIEITDEHVIFKKYDNLEGPVYKYDLSKVIGITYENGVSEMFIQTEAAFEEKNEKDLKNGQAVYVEGGGNGLTFAFNFDVRFLKGNNGPGMSVGFGGWKTDFNSSYSVPIVFNYLAGKGRHLFELGAGIVIHGNSDNDLYFFPTASKAVGTMTFAYRLQPEKTGFVFRAGFHPFFGKFVEYDYHDFEYHIEETSFGFVPYFGGISFGYKFK